MKLLGLATVAIFATVAAFSAPSPGEAAVAPFVGRAGEETVLRLWPAEGFAPAGTHKSWTETIEDGRVIRGVSQPSLVVIPPPRRIESSGLTVVFVPDGQRAIRVLRANAEALGTLGNKILVMGVSAGGHLSINLANNHAEQIQPPMDAIDRLDAKPDVVITLAAAYMIKPVDSLRSDPHLKLNKASLARTAPVFMAVSKVDTFAWAAVDCMAQLRKAKVPAELHIYSEGGHGGEMVCYPIQHFRKEAARFLVDQKVFKEPQRQASDAWVARRLAPHLDTQVPASTGQQPKPIVTLAEAKWAESDKRLAAKHGAGAEALALWPGDGKRSDDPGRDIREVFPERSDGRLRMTGITAPTLHLWRPKKPDGRAVIVFPGGAFGARC